MKVISMKGLVEKAHGKICQDSDSSVAYRKKDGAMFSQRRCNPRDLNTNPYTTKEKDIQSKFSTNSKIAAAWTAKNRVLKDDGSIDYENCTSDYKKMRTAFNAQDKYVTFQAFVWAQIKDGAVVVPDVAVSSEDDDEETPSTTKYSLSLSASPAAGGTVTGAGEYEDGASASISAVANSGYTFSKWSDDDTNASRTITMSESKSLQAIFTADAGGSEGGTNPGTNTPGQSE